MKYAIVFMVLMLVSGALDPFLHHWFGNTSWWREEEERNERRIQEEVEWLRKGREGKEHGRNA